MEAPSPLPISKQGRILHSPVPSCLFGRRSVRLFNALHYRWGRKRPGIVHPDRFFFPLDRWSSWNRLYGSSGFTQYQCVLPLADDPGLYRRFLAIVTARGYPCYLCVVKDCGSEGEGLLSFPMPGISFALDLPIRRGEIQELVDALNEFVIGEGGRIYLAKDAFTRPDHFRSMEPRFEEWQRVRRRWDPEESICSALSVRLMGDRPLEATGEKK